MYKEEQHIDWFFAANDNCKMTLEIAKVAVISAKRFKINKYCIYSGAEDEFVKFLEDHQVKVIRQSFSLGDELKRMRPDLYNIGSGAYLRIDIPEVIAENHLPIGDYFLYTDCDVMFQNDPVPKFLELKTDTFFASSEGSKVRTDYFNTGVMWVNLLEAQQSNVKLKECIIQHHFSFEAFKQGTFDQGALNRFYENRYDFLDTRFNWKPYWGKNEEAVVVHFHGPKPVHYRHYKNTKEFLDPVFHRFFNNQTTESYDFYVNNFYNLLELSRQH